jgi:carboxypeptidase Q
MCRLRLLLPVLPVVVLVAGATVAAQQEPLDRAMVARIRAEATQRSKVLETFNYITNVTGARLTGSRAHKQAAEYMRDRLAGWGLANAHLESFPFDRGGWELQKFTLELTAPRYFPMYGYPAAWSTSTKGVLEGTPVYIGDKTVAEVEALGERLRGAIVLMSPPQTVFNTVDRLDPTVSGQPAGTMPPSAAPAAATVQPRGWVNQVLTLLGRFGAGAVLRPSAGKDDTIFVTGAVGGQDAVPQVTVVAEHYNMIVRMMQTGVAPRLRLELRTAFEPADKVSYNVIAEIPGEDPVLKNQVVLLGAHLDSWHAATGATDNADGAAAASEAMRILQAIGARPRRTIRLALWSGEEVGFLGGKAYVEQHLKDQASRDAIAVYLNDDPGTGKTLGWFMANNQAAKKIFDSWVDQLKDLGLRRNTMDAYFSSEDGVFDGVGVPAFTTIQQYTNYDVRLHHTNTDFYENISEQDLQQSATVLAVFAYQAAMRNEPFPRRPADVPANPFGGRGRGGRGRGGR